MTKEQQRKAIEELEQYRREREQKAAYHKAYYEQTKQQLKLARLPAMIANLEAKLARYKAELEGVKG